MASKSTNFVSIDDMLSFVGEFGKFQMMLETVFCIMIFPQTYQILIMYFAALKSPWRCIANTTCLLNGTQSIENTARCNMDRNVWEYTQPKGYSIVTQFDVDCGTEWLRHLTTSIFFVGWIFGAIVLSWVGDNYGRKIVLFPSTGTVMVIGLVTAFMPNIGLFVFCRFLAGFLMPGCSLQSFILISEVVGGKYRSTAGILLWLFFAVALCMTGLKAYYIREWKLLFIVCTAPYLLFVLFYKVVPESVRWLTLHGKTDKAMDIFKRMAVWNKNEIPAEVKLVTPTPRHNNKSSALDLFRSRRMAASTLIQGFAWFVNAMVYYGLSLAADDLGGSLYLNYILVSIVEFPAHITAVIFCERLGRKKTVISTMIVGSVVCVIVAFIPSKGDANYARIVLGMLGKMFITISFDSIYTWSLEIYPTSIRGNGMGFMQITSRIGAASAPWVAKGMKTLHKTVPFIFMGVTTFCAASLLFILPETKDAGIIETDTELDKVNSAGKTTGDIEMKEGGY